MVRGVPGSARRSHLRRRLMFCAWFNYSGTQNLAMRSSGVRGRLPSGAGNGAITTAQNKAVFQKTGSNHLPVREVRKRTHLQRIRCSQAFLLECSNLLPRSPVREVSSTCSSCVYRRRYKRVNRLPTKRSTVETYLLARQRGLLFIWQQRRSFRMRRLF